MEAESKLNKMLNTSRDPQEVQDWIFSLTPLGVAFVFFFLFMLAMDIPDKTLVLVVGIAAGFTGLQSYWVFRGWCRNHFSTVLMGVIGISITLAALWAYLTIS
jgi:hypothetical protein